ncbi:MAG: Xaa-Pro peptidase family protein [Spirochaetota bacterium]
MEQVLTPAKEIESRVAAVQKLLQASDMEALFIVQRMDLFYFSGTAQNGYLYIPAQGEPLLMIKKYFPRAKEETSIKHIVQIDSVSDIKARIVDFYGRLPNVIGFEFDVMPVSDFYFFQKVLDIANCRDGSPLIHAVRAIKSAWEIKQIETVTELTYKTFKFINKELRPGLSEMEFAGMYETFERRHGHQGRLRARNYLSELYNWHLLSGESGSMPGLLDSPASGQGTSPSFPVGAGRKKLKKNEPIMIDIGFALNGYHVDETRMFAMGKMPEKALKTCEASIEIHNSIIEMAGPGVPIGEVYKYAVEKAEALGYKDQFLGTEGYKVTFVGHGIGIELVEPPILARNRKEELQPGMVFALEPKFVFENEFIAGVESVFTVTETGARLLSKVPVKVFVKK